MIKDVSELNSDIKTELNITSKQGRILVPAGTCFTKPLIKRLQFYGFEQVEIGGEIPVANNNNSREERLILKSRIAAVTKKQTFQFQYATCIAMLKSLFKDIDENKPADFSSLVDKTKELTTAHYSTKELFTFLSSLRAMDDPIYMHSINVAIISNIYATWLGMSEDDKDVALLCGLLHDIGKYKIPDEILNKPGKYTDEEFEIIRSHPMKGHNMLKGITNLSPHVKRCTLMHHERCDGSGYPMGLIGDECGPFSQLIAIADVYDAMTSARSYRAPLSPFQVIEVFQREGLQKYNPKYILPVVKQTAAMYRNCRVLLNDGKSATIIMQNERNIARPIVQTQDGSLLDLSANPNLYIQMVL